MKLRVAFAGTPAFAVPALHALAAAHEVVGVLTQPDRPAGRGRVLTASPVKQAALALSLPVLQPVRLRGDGEALQATLEQLRAWRVEVLVVVAYGLILPRELLELPRLGCLNIHASLLPRWRGAAPIQRAILAGDAETGISIMQMDEGLDTGAVLCTGRVPIGAECTAGELHDVLSQEGARQILVALDGVARGTMAPTLQPEKGVTYAAKLAKSEARIDWSRAARDIDRQVRAFNPWPAAQTTLDGEPVKVLRSRCGSERLHAAPTSTNTDASTRDAVAPGTWLGPAGDALRVQCGDGELQVLELQRAGRRALPARDFLNAMQPADRAGKVFQ